MSELFAQPPRSLCLMRLSAVGDISHTLPIVNTIREHWPRTKITWIIGKVGYQLVQHLPDIEFIVFDKARGLGAYLELGRALRGRRFDVLLLTQYSLRAQVASLFVKAPLRIGYDRARSKELHGLFINRRIAARPAQHVLDGFFCFLEALGIEAKVLRWNRCYGADETHFAKRHLPGGQQSLLISPCASHPLRNWPSKRYAAIADHAVQRHGMRVLLTGGVTGVERRCGDEIRRHARVEILDLVGQTGLRQLAALIARATVVLAPDSGPIHLATGVGTPVIALFATSNPDRSGPYLEREWCLNRYPDAVREHLGRAVEDVRWGTNVLRPGVMEKIGVAEVKAVLDRLLVQRAGWD